MFFTSAMDIASALNALFVALVVFYVCIHSCLTIFEVRTAEASANIVPAAFRFRISLAQHRKAVDYSGELLQCDLVNSILGAAIAVVLTFGGGLSVILAGITAISGQGLASQCILLAGMTLLLALIDLPVAWWRDFRVNERYGFEKTPSRKWIVSRINELLAGWMTALPVVCAFSFICVSASYHWWIFAFFLTFCWYLWKIILAPNWFIGYAADVKPMQQGELKDKLAHLLKELGHPTAEVFVADRPRSWRHGHAILASRPGQTRLILFKHVFKELSDEEVLAVAACAIGRINRWHNAARLAFFTALSGLFWYGFAWLSEKEFFYRALNIEPALAMPEGTVNPALLFIILLTVVPVVLYPAVFFIHGFTRMLDYDEDAYAVTHVGAKPLARALAKLHRDYRRSLTPNRFYSLANHRRPHVTQRIEAALLTEKRDRRHTANAAVDEKRARAALYNAVLAKRREERNERLALRVQLKSEKLREAANLRMRGFSLPAH